VRTILIKETLSGLSVRDATALTGPNITEMDKAMRALKAKT
jgi:hypothetical protein